MKNSTAKVLKATAIALYLTAVTVGVAIITTGSIAYMVLVPTIVIFAIALHAYPDIQATNYIKRTFNP